MDLSQAHNSQDGNPAVVKKTIFAGLWVTAMIQLFSLFMPVNDTNWPVSMAWGSLLIPAFCVYAYQSFKYKNYSSVAVVSLCAAAWLFGFFSRFDLGIDALLHIGLAFLLTFTHQDKTVNIALVMAALGVVMYIVGATNTLWWVGLNVLFGLTVISPTVKRKQLYAPKTRAFNHQDQQQAA